MSIAHHGRSHLMLNREKQRIAGDKISKNREEEKRQKEAIEILVKEVEQFKNELKHTEYDKSEADYNWNLLGRLFDEKIIDKDGRPIATKHEGSLNNYNMI